MEIRKSTREDLDAIMAIYARARSFMAEHGNEVQWGDYWPPRQLIEDDIANGVGHVCVDDGEIVAVFAYFYGEDIDPTYRVIEGGEWLAGGPYGVVHRIASSGAVRGVGSFCLNWAYEQSNHHLRIDTHADNVVMRNLLAKLGFSQRGIIYVREDNLPRLAFEKL